MNSLQFIDPSLSKKTINLPFTWLISTGFYIIDINKRTTNDVLNFCPIWWWWYRYNQQCQEDMKELLTWMSRRHMGGEMSGCIEGKGPRTNNRVGLWNLWECSRRRNNSPPLERKMNSLVSPRPGMIGGNQREGIIHRSMVAGGLA